MPLSQLAISSTNQKCIDMLKEKRKNYFEKEKDIAIFAAIYAISKVDLTKYSLSLIHISKVFPYKHGFSYPYIKKRRRQHRNIFFPRKP